MDTYLETERQRKSRSGMKDEPFCNKLALGSNIISWEKLFWGICWGKGYPSCLAVLFLHFMVDVQWVEACDFMKTSTCQDSLVFFNVEI